MVNVLRFAALVVGLAIAAPWAQAQPQTQAWPQRPVRLIVPFGAGSATDLTARLFAERLSVRWGQPALVENRPGADSIVAVNAFVASHDDHTLLYSAPGPITVNPVLYRKLPYDPAHDPAPSPASSTGWRRRASSISCSPAS
jgi:tripartite-type tricarboxylate transporter receptor subunit TctC